MPKKKIYRIPCEWKMWGILEIEAENLEEAKRLAIEEYPLPEDDHYVEDSFELDFESGLYEEII